MREDKLPMNGDEEDAFSPWYRRHVFWQRGEVRRIKRQYNKRVRARGKRLPE